MNLILKDKQDSKKYKINIVLIVPQIEKKPEKRAYKVIEIIETDRIYVNAKI